jgi:capsular exopolysaccharide synthesis family protein
MRHLPILPSERQIERRSNAEYIVLSQPDNGQASHFSAYVRILKKRKWWILIPFCLVMALGIVQMALESPVYQATATLLIDDVNPQIAPVQEIIPPETSPNFYNTQYQIIRGRSIVGKLVTRLQLDQQPLPETPLMERMFKAIPVFVKRQLRGMINMLQGLLSETPAVAQSDGPVVDPAERRWLETVTRLQARVQVRPRLATKLVDIVMQGPDPEAVVEQVNTLAEIYIQENLDAKLAESRKAIAWLQQESAALRQKTDQGALALEQFKSGKDYLPTGDLGPQPSTAVQRLERLNQTYVETNTARLQLETQIAELKKISKKRLQEILEFPGMEENLFLRTLKSQYLEAQLEYANLAQRFGPKHPRLIQIKANLDERAQAIGAEIRNMINQLQKDYDTLLAKENMLTNELASQKTEVFGFSDDVRQFQTLRRDLEIDQNLHLAVSKRHAEATLSEALTTNNIRLVEQAIASIPVSEAVKTMALNLVLGLMLGVGLALITEYFDKRFKSADEAERYLELPCLGIIPHYRSSRRLKRPITLQNPDSRIAEAYRTVRSWLQSPMPRPMKSLLITSATPGEGKSTTAANLGVSFAQLGWHVLLVDIDLRRPALHRNFGLTHDNGLTDILVHGTDWHHGLRDTELENLKVLPAGFIPSNPVDLLSTRRMQAFTAQVTRAFDLVIFDAPIVLSLPEVTILAPHMDGVILVHSPLHRDRDVALQAKRLLERRGAPLVGVVLNNISQKDMSDYTSYRYEGDYAPTVRRIRLDNGAVVQQIDMQPGEDGKNWRPEPAAVRHRGRGATLTSSEQRTASLGNVAITIHAVSFQQHLADEESTPGGRFLVLDLELANDAASPYTFYAEQTSVAAHSQNEYSRVLASLIEVPSHSGAAHPLQGRPVYKYDALLTCQLEEGFGAEETVAAQSVRRGYLVYRVPLAVDSYVFEYETAVGACIIPLGTA